MKLIGASIILFGLQVSYCSIKAMGPNGFWKELLADYAVQYALPLLICGIGWEVWKFNMKSGPSTRSSPQKTQEAASASAGRVWLEAAQPEAEQVAAAQEPSLP